MFNIGTIKQGYGLFNRHCLSGKQFKSVWDNNYVL